MRWCLSEQGLKPAGPLLSASLPRIPPHLCQGQNKGILTGPAAVALPAQEEVEAYEEHEEETRAFVFKRLCMRAPGSKCQTGMLALFSKKDSHWDALRAPQARGNRFENWNGTPRAPCSRNPLFFHPSSTY